MKNLNDPCSERNLLLVALLLLLIIAALSNKMANLFTWNESELISRRTIFNSSLDMFEEGNKTVDKTSAYNLPTASNISSGFNFQERCDVSGMMTSLYNQNQPLTSQDLAKLRGCLVLLFFRSPRCGSTALNYLLDELSRKLKYESTTMYASAIGRHYNWVDFIDRNTKKNHPVAVTCHQKAVNVMDEPIKPGVMINLIRYPIDHLVSIFKLRKFGDRQNPNEEVRQSTICNMTFSDYILTHGFEQPCIADGYMGLRYLAGKMDCQNRSVCLQRAKQNLETLYLAVGVSENIPAFLLVMETLLPQFFEGSLHQYTRMAGLYQMFSPDPNREEMITPAALDYLNKVLAPDIELYHYVQQRQYLTVKKVVEYRANNDLVDSPFLRHVVEPAA